MEDMHQVAIDTLLRSGTPFATELALEIDRGRQRRQIKNPRQDWDPTRAEHDREFMLKQLRPARPGEYDQWLRGFILAGGTPTHHYNYPTPQMFVPVVDVLIIRPLYGAGSLGGILIPQGVVDDGGMTGHTTLYYQRGFMVRGFHDREAHWPGRSSIVPVYSDTQAGAEVSS